MGDREFSQEVESGERRSPDREEGTQMGPCTAAKPDFFVINPSRAGSSPMVGGSIGDRGG